MHNRKLLQTILAKNITLIDYEVLTDDKGRRLIAFGYYAGMVGAHNALTYGKRTGDFSLKRLHKCFDYAEAKALYPGISWPAVKIVLTGGGRVASGAVRTLRDMGIRQVSPQEYLGQDFDEIVFTQLNCGEYAQRKDGKAFDMQDFSLIRLIMKAFLSLTLR